MNQKSRAARLADAIASMRGGLEEAQAIKEELENWRDGLTGTNLENSDLYSKLEEAVDILDSAVSEIESQLDELESVEVPTGFRG